MSNKLPPEKKNQIVDVSLKHIVLLFITLVFCAILVGSAIVLLRDFSRYRRQKATIDAITQLILTIKDLEKGGLWKQLSSSPKKKTN